MIFSINDVVWGKVQGYPYWPCIISYHKPDLQKCRVIFYGDNMQGEIKYQDLKNFEEHFDQYTLHAKKNNNLRIAIEAVLKSELYSHLQPQYDRIIKNGKSENKTQKSHSESSKSRQPRKIEIFIQKYFQDLTHEMTDSILEICNQNEKKVVKAIKVQEHCIRPIHRQEQYLILILFKNIFIQDIKQTFYPLFQNPMNQSYFFDIYMLITNICLASASCAALRGIILLRREKYFAKMFEDVDKMPLYNLAYIQSTTDLPPNKYLLLAGKVQSENLHPTFSDRSVKAVLSTVLPTVPEKQKDLGDGLIVTLGRISNYQREQPLEFTLGAGDCQLRVKQQQRQKLYLFNLPKMRDNIIKTELKSLRISNMSVFHSTYTEYALLPDKDYVVCGKLTSDGTFDPRIILGTAKESFIDSLDDHLLDLNKQAKYWLIGSFLITITAAVYARIYKKSRKTNQYN